MCGIAGTFNSKSISQLAKSKYHMFHRGPDDSGIFVSADRSVGLVHTRLSIQDLSPMGHQPMQSDDGFVTLVFNGEIYNFNELKLELQQKGIIFRGNSDTEVLLNLYLIYDVDMLTKLNGIFAFAIWDERTNSLFLSRDALGVKPLYYSNEGNEFSFASELKALIPLINYPLSIDFVALQRYLTFLWSPGEDMPAKEVKKLGPGEALILRSGCIVKHWKWYKPPIFHGFKKNMSADDAIEATTKHLRAAVHRQLIPDVPVGAFLSGGLDSSSIVAFSREVNPMIACFTIDIGDLRQLDMVNDLPYARTVAKHLNVPLHVVRIDSARMAKDLMSMVTLLDEPLADLSSLNVLYISRLARENGIKVLLSGSGGDDLFTGYRRHKALSLEKYWSWLPKTALLKLERVTKSLDTNIPFSRRLRKFFNGASLNDDERLVNYFRWIDRADLANLYSAEFREALGNSRAEEPFFDFLKGLPADLDRVERMLALEQRFFLADHNLIYTDKMSMAVGVEVRVPFLDLELVEFAAKIPTNLKQKGIEGKWVLKKAMEPYLPREVIYRPKSGFGVPLRSWMRNELRELLADTLDRDSLKRRGLFDPIAVQNLVIANDRGVVDGSYTLLSLVCIELWCRHFIDLQANQVSDFSEVA